MKIAFFKLENWEKEIAQKYFEGQEILFFDSFLNKDSIPEIKDFEIASVFVDSEIDAQVLEALPQLKFIVTRSTGFDHIDLKSCAERNILVSNVPAYGDNTVAEFTFGLMICLMRKIFLAYDRIKETGSFSVDGLKGVDLKGKTLGVIGTGRIGGRVIKIAKGFEMNVVAYDPFPNQKLSEEFNFPYLSFEEVLKSADIITLHVPYSEKTHHLINKDNISLIKKGAYLINTSRGGIVETEALVKALQEGILAGAGLDVLEEEGVIKDEMGFLFRGHPEEHDLKTVLANHILIDMDNVIITPHNAFNSQEALQRILETSLGNIKAFISSSPVNLVK